MTSADRIRRVPIRHLAFASALGAAIVAIAGPLNPPVGPVASTHKTLTEIEPRTNVAALTGSATARHVIAISGSYYLSANIAGAANLSGIVIQVDNVTLDLNGFSIVGAIGSGDGVQIGGTRTNITIKNGVIRGWTGEGIDAADDTAVTVTGVSLSNNGSDGLTMGNGGQVTGCTSANNAGDGFQVGEGSQVAGCTSTGNTLEGIRIFVAGGATDAGGSVVSACHITRNGGNGLNASNSAVSACASSYNGGTGFLVSNSSAVDCEARANGVHGFAGGNVVFSRCTTRSNTLDGFNLSEGSLVESSVSRGNGNDGIEAARECTVRGNHCEDNGLGGPLAAGIRVLGSDNRIDSNTCTNNLNTGILVPAGSTLNTIHRNACTGNTPNFSVVGVGNDVGPMGTAATSTSPWANIQF